MKNIFLYLIVTVFVLFSFQYNVFAEEARQLDLKSEGAVLLDSETNAILYAKNADEKMYPASLTKIATAIYAIEKGNLDSIVTVSANAVRQDGTRVYLNEGEQVPLKKLIQGMLINSGNDAAVAIAEYLDGDVKTFAESLNSYLKNKIGVTNTHFTNPNGLHDENHYTTAMDLALITNYALKNPTFAEIFGTKVLDWQGQSWSTRILTHHRMLKGELPYPGISGGKTGYTTEAKQTLATTAGNGNLKLTAVVLKSDLKNDKYKDTAVLFDYGFKGYQHETINQGVIFKSGNKEFYPESDIVITEDVSGNIKTVNDEGLLSIENNNGQVLQKVQLKYKDPPKSKSAEIKSKKANKKESPLILLNTLIGLLLITGAGTLIQRQRRRKVSRYY
ncbi:D-alanyl-D-alanine carboxypeptidase (penicillin-binding protein 5/6) [Bacillus sp. SORGH_AS 510]|uniref:D-alanyl-D-alanine carboxypeptidase family protein n=1 Tax=Bacillus sp. SORGH_AS_0510 TaxID=3041771 RepID=UPI00278904B8|nr:D-alanyl-D-alanine carboxypeptidase family protein [Bacillus sp. SORGH_AS_0510]MDQ1145472.1 D-alanyl-D-alanine carboxypeptidase (penicillin-binding protein 5/6) [Bacillus sp. SORGH_AS_0510]